MDSGGAILVVKLKRTDTTLDLSQKARVVRKHDTPSWSIYAIWAPHGPLDPRLPGPFWDTLLPTLRFTLLHGGWHTSTTIRSKLDTREDALAEL